MDAFEFVKTATNDEQAIFFLSECARIAMQQYYPQIQTVYDLEDNVDLNTVYDILDVAAGVKIKKDSNNVKQEAVESGATWETFDLAKLESELFLLGIWKDYEELETSLSMPELMSALEAKRELDYTDKKFFAAMQGVDLDKESGKDKQDAWQKLKAKVFSGGKTSDSNDITALQGFNAQKAGFGIGMGLGYQDLTKK
ncbi:MAG: hypothetical protein EBS31_00045 [Burkholderiaceae bacterium]|nr:hypothetical protein [Burkholderiaceae bacterium]